MRKVLLAPSLVTFLSIISLLGCKKEIAYSGSNLRGGNVTSVTTYPPIAYAGVDTTIYSPFTSCFLNSKGTKDPDNNIASFTWRFIAGPTPALIGTPKTTDTNVGGLFLQGAYSFELTVVDKDNWVARDTVVVTVGDPNCTSQQKEIVLSNLDWDLSWIMEINIKIDKILPPRSRVKHIFIKRDNNSTWVPLVPYETNYNGQFHTWDYGTNILIIYPPSTDMVKDTPDVKITYCN